VLVILSDDRKSIQPIKTCAVLLPRRGGGRKGTEGGGWLRFMQKTAVKMQIIRGLSSSSEDEEDIGTDAGVRCWLTVPVLACA